MNQRKRLIAIGVVAAVVLGVGYAIVNALFLAPAAELEKAAGEYAEDIRKLRQNADVGTVAMVRLRELASQTFGTDRNKVSADVHAHLDQLLVRSGLVKESIRATVGGKRKGYEIISRSVAARGPLQRAVDFLYLLEQQPYLHRVDDVVIKRIEQSPDVRLTCRYSTLIVLGADNEPIVPQKRQPTTDKSYGDLDSEDRKVYTVIARRNLLMPYVKKPPQRVVRRPPPRRTESPQPKPQPPRPAHDPLASLRVNDLSQWNDKQDVRVEGPHGQSTLYHPGDKLAGGEIVMVDIRPLPIPDKPELTSPSRVILKIGNEYWAVELGKPLSTRRRLPEQQLPDELKEDETTTQPATAESSKTDTARENNG
ncbi:MAG: hypothetical protein ACLFV7_00550 [Phycisphaerae bacterium]